MHSGLNDPEGSGCPIRKSQDHSSVTSSSGLIAGSHVLHRLSTPRHPPCALIDLVTPTRTRWRCPSGPHRVPAGVRQTPTRADIAPGKRPCPRAVAQTLYDTCSRCLITLPRPLRRDSEKTRPRRVAASSHTHFTTCQRAARNRLGACAKAEKRATGRESAPLSAAE